MGSLPRGQKERESGVSGDVKHHALSQDLSCCDVTIGAFQSAGPRPIYVDREILYFNHLINCPSRRGHTENF